MNDLFEPEEITQPVDIIMPTHDNLKMTLQAVEALYENTRAPFHLIVVDDSTDITPQYFEWLKKEHNNITFIHSDEPYTSGNQIFNIGLQHGESPYATTVTNSVRVEPDWESIALKLMDNDPKIGVIGFKSLYPHGLIESAGVGMANFMPIDLGRNEPGHRFTCIYETVAVQWAFALLRKDAVKDLEVGNYRWDENVYNGFRGWDDLDNCFMLRENGWKVVYCGFGAGYHTPRATRGLGRKEAHQVNHENSIIFYKRWGLWDKVKQNVRAEWNIAQQVDRTNWKNVKGVMSK